ncbi:hypothetical protein MKX08_002982 [Trichoderma sp. CBMAI-0020]|nr:hypothetical protein MKX08_002982 [Trichoderma sp. CBMAI-0020]
MQAEPVEASLLRYRDAERIVGIKLATYVFPHADEYISSKHRRQFAILVEIFQQHLHKYPETSLEHSARTEFQLKMCGGHRLTAEPSIVIAHPCNDPTTGLAILETLTQPQIRDQYELHSTTRFQIYLSLRPTFEYLASPSDSFNICIKSPYFPGAVLASADTRDNVSTITCGIRFSNTDDTIFALTPAHAIQQIALDGVKSIQKGTSGSPSTLNETQATCILADVEYDMDELRQLEKAMTEAIVRREHDSKLGKRRGEGNLLSPGTQVISPRRAWGRSGQSNTPNLDWALVEIDPSDGRIAADGVRQVFALADEKRAVQIMTPRGKLHGMIRRSLTFITNSGSDGPLCEIWTVTVTGLTDGDVRMGDSGSLVIDTVTSQPCGYVVAVNRVQELYVIPLCLVLQQIAETVSIPNVRPKLFLNLKQTQQPIQAQGPDFGILMTYFSQLWSRTKAEEQRRPAWLRKLRAKCCGGWSYVRMGVRNLWLPSIQKLSRYGFEAYNQNNRFSDSPSRIDYIEQHGHNGSQAIHRAGGNSSQDSFAPLVNNQCGQSCDIPLKKLARPPPTKAPSYGWPITTDNDPINSYGHRIFPGNPIMDARVYDQDASILSPVPTRSPPLWTAGAPEGSFQIIQHIEIRQNTRRVSAPLPVNGMPVSSPPAENTALNREELPLLPTSLSRRKQKKVLGQASRHLSKCALEFCNRHQLPNTVIQGMEPRERPFVARNLGRKRAPDCGWGEFVFLLKFLIAEQQVPLEALNSDLAAHFRAILHASLGVDDVLRHAEPLRDDRTILRILSAGVQVANMLNDEKAMGKLRRLLMKTERTMIETGA